MSPPLQKTKLFIPPIRTQLVSRPRLLDRLDALQADACRVAVISAPAGSGKTTTVVQWLNRLGWPVGWVSLDPRDNNPARFFGYVAAALSRILPGVGEQALALLELPGANMEEVVTLLANDLTEAPGPFILALDDFHTITQPALHHAVDLLLEAQPPQMRLLLLSREDPTLQLSRRRVRGQLIELRQDDLRFSLDETIAFLNHVMELHLTAAQVERLEARTEGWIAGLQLAALSLSNTPDADHFIDEFSGSHRFILDYLIEEVLAHQSPEIQDFLLQTSVLESMCADLCAAATGQTIPEAQALLEHLARANLFVIPLDEDRQWFRYHHLFGDLLRAQLSARAAGQMAALYRRASVWVESHGDPRMGVEYALKAQDPQRAADLIERHITLRWQTVDWEFFLLINRLPMQVILARPSLCLQTAWTCVLYGQSERIPALLDAAEQGLLAPGRTPEPGDLANHAFARILRANQDDMLNRPVAIDDTLEQAFTAIPDSNVGMRNSVAVVLGTLCYMQGDFAIALRYFMDALERDKRVNGTNAVPICAMRMAWVYQAQGRLFEAVELLHEQADYIHARGSRRFYISGAIYLAWGEILLEWNQLDAAEEKIREGLRLLEDWPLPQILCQGLCLLSQLQLARGDLQAANSAFAQAVALQQNADFHPKLRYAVDRTMLKLWFAAQNMPGLEAWAQEHAYLADQETSFRFEPPAIELCRVWLALDRKPEAVRLLERLDAAAQARNGSRIAILSLLAAAWSGDPERAQAALEQALCLAEPQGYVRTFLSAGEPMRQALKTWLHNNRSRQNAPTQAYVARLLATFGGSQAIQPFATAASLGLPEPLSERELEVLRLVAHGLTNQQIADRLVISVRTVKKHVENIHGKLGAQNRTDAVARGRALGLLSE
jgi:LuxR family transcriptional regulator, maltose regulon positive regulatory protein